MSERTSLSQSDPSSIIDDSNRVDQIVRVDTGALLTVIRELEIKLSEHHRQVDSLHKKWLDQSMTRTSLVSNITIFADSKK